MIKIFKGLKQRCQRFFLALPRLDDKIFPRMQNIADSNQRKILPSKDSAKDTFFQRYGERYFSAKELPSSFLYIQYLNCTISKIHRKYPRFTVKALQVLKAYVSETDRDLSQLDTDLDLSRHELATKSTCDSYKNETISSTILTRRYSKVVLVVPW